MRVRALAVAAVGALVAVPLGAVGAAATDTDTDENVTVVHAIPLEVAAEVSVYAVAAGEEVTPDTAPLIPSLAFEDIRPLAVPAGDYRLEVRTVDADPGDDVLGDLLVEADPVTVPDPETPVSVVAQLDADGNPVLTPYVDDFSELGDGLARAVVRHAAPVGPVDIAVSGPDDVSADITGLANGSQSESLDVPAGAYDVETSLDGTVVEELSATGLPLDAGIVYNVYAIATDVKVDDGKVKPKEFSFLIDAVELVDGEPQPGDTPTPSPSETTAPADDDDDETPVIPTAVPAGDGTSGWTGPLALPALLAIGVGAVLAVAVALVVRRGATQG